MNKIPDLASKPNIVETGNDSIVIRNALGYVKGGRTLDMDGFADAVVKAGHVIIKNSTTEEYKPMPVVDGAYDSLPDGYEYAGVLVGTVLASAPFASILYAGEVNDEASPYSVASIKAAMKSALPQLVFMHD